MGWTTRREAIPNPAGEILAVARDGDALTVFDVISAWRDDEGFRAFFIGELAAAAYPAFFWEMPPLTRATLSNPFECALIRSDALARTRADDSDFARHLNSAPAPVTAFRNLGGDAMLIAPRKISAADCYGHIAVFARFAPPEQQHALFRLLALETRKLLEARASRFWISTSGLGVPWVHVRLDSYPKYYQYRSYAEQRT